MNWCTSCQRFHQWFEWMTNCVNPTWLVVDGQATFNRVITPVPISNNNGCADWTDTIFM